MAPLKGWFGIGLNLTLAVLALAGAVLCVTVFRGGNHQSALEIRDADTGRRYGRRPLAADGVFAIEFVHSVNNSPVREIFRAEGNGIRPVAARFYSFGAGMQSDLEAGQVLSRDGDAMVISGPDRCYNELNYIVGTVSDHLLIISDETVSLRDLCGRNAHIIISIK
jgi:hypothetical protein